MTPTTDKTGFKPKAIVRKLLSSLPERSRVVVEARFGLDEDVGFKVPRQEDFDQLSDGHGVDSLFGIFYGHFPSLIFKFLGIFYLEAKIGDLVSASAD